MHPLPSFLRVALPLAALLTACGATVSGTTDASTADVVTTDAIATDVITSDVITRDATASCTLPNGTICAAGAQCRFGCGTCTCPPGGGTAQCGGLACADVPPPDIAIDIPTASSCASSDDCLGGRVCYFAVGACGARGTCNYARDCASITPYCGCDGETFMDCPGGETTSPASRTGACPTPDAGPVDAGPVDAGTPDAALCAGASIGPDRRSCLGPADGSLPLWCCTGWDCDQSHAACDSLPPRCAEGEVPTVAGACWGPCVPMANCARRP